MRERTSWPRNSDSGGDQDDYLDDFPFSKILRPMLSVVDIDVYDMGMQAGKYILQKIRKPNMYIQSHITIPSLIVRDSTWKGEALLLQRLFTCGK